MPVIGVSEAMLAKIKIKETIMRYKDEFFLEEAIASSNFLDLSFLEYFSIIENIKN